MKTVKFYSGAILIAILLFTFTYAYSQTTNISGIINIYTPVISIQCNNVTVDSSAGFSAGDRVMLIQMKGATIDLTNTASFGTILSYNDAGNYEFNIIASIAGSTIYFTNQVLRTYTTSGLVQLIRVPQYVNANVTGTLTCPPWNGTTGGVLVFEATSTVTLNANIVVSGLGLMGGNRSINYYPGCSSMDYFYTMASGLGGQKGEGITAYTVAFTAGRGALANGGGGANNVNAGGGGGGNYAQGGRGGNQWAGCPIIPIGGDGGENLNYNNVSNKIFLGGGGGGGHQNNNVGTSGTNGGGIVIIKANTITGNFNSILANGNNNTLIAGNDGAGGGGAGGTVLLDAGSFIGLTVSTNGGNGGSTNAGTCHAPGGGGAGGIVWVSSSLAGITTSLIGGIPGVASCNGTNYGALAGQNGDTLTGLVLPEGIPISAPTASNTGAYCAGQTIQLNSTGGTSYSWSGPLAYSNAAQNPTIVASTAAMTGTYTVTATNAAGCTSTTTTIVTVNALPIPTASNTGAYCAGQTIQLNSTGGTSYSWSGPLAYSNAAQNPTIVASTAAMTGTYTVTGTNAAGCNSTATTIVTVNALPVPTASNTGPYCSGATIQLNSTGGTSYSWSGPLAYTNATQNPSIPGSTVAATGTYTVTATNAAGCTGTVTIVVLVNEIPIPLFAGDVLSGCIPLCVNFTDQSTVVGSTIASWNWTVQGQNPVMSQNVNYCFNSPGQYDAAVTVTSVAGCSAILSLANYIMVSGNPIADFMYAPEKISILDPNVIFGNTSSGATSYVWDFGDGSNSVAINPTHTYADTGSYCVNLLATNSFGCMDTTMHCLSIKPELTIYIPNTFTVNEDGLNEIWNVVGIGIKTISVRIFDRWGDEIYFFDNIDKGWPGNHQNGNPCKQDVYVYRIEVVDGNNDFHEYLGGVNLIR